MAKRRPAGDGLVRKRSDGRWEGRIVVGHKADGRPIFRSVFARTQGELLKKLHAQLEAYRDVELTEASNLTLGQWLDKWLTDYMTLTLRESTLIRYKGMIEHQIKPYLGEEKISAISTADIQKLYNWLRENGRVEEHYEKGNALSDSMVRGVHMPNLHGAPCVGELWGGFAENLRAAIRPPIFKYSTAQRNSQLFPAFHAYFLRFSQNKQIFLMEHSLLQNPASGVIIKVQKGVSPMY